MRTPRKDDRVKKRNTRNIVGGRNGTGALNALRHGLLSKEPIIPGESVREFRKFQSRVVESLAPRNALQRIMATRIAKLAWRLQRVEPYEAAVIAQSLQAGEREAAKAVEGAGHATPSAVLKLSLSTIRSGLRLLTRLPDLPADTRVRSNKVLEVLSFVADLAEMKLDEVIDLSAATVEVDSLSRHPLIRSWTPGEILEAIAQIAGRSGKQPEGLRVAAVVRLTMLSVFAEAEARRVFAVHDLHRRLRLVPDAGELDGVIRYEAHLSRQLTVMLHEYEALQARDHGERAPLARLDVQGLD